MPNFELERLNYPLLRDCAWMDASTTGATTTAGPAGQNDLVLLVFVEVARFSKISGVLFELFFGVKISLVDAVIFIAPGPKLVDQVLPDHAVPAGFLHHTEWQEHRTATAYFGLGSGIDSAACRFLWFFFTRIGADPAPW